MTTILLGALVAFAMGTAIEGYLQFGRVQILLNYAERLLGTVGNDEQLADHATVIDGHAADIDAICAHVGLELVDNAPDVATDEIPAQPQTEPMERAWDAALVDLQRPTPFPRTTSTGGRHRK